MTKYLKSREALPSNLHLWDPFPTQTALTETRVMDFYPTSSIQSSDMMTFTIPAMQNYMLDKVEIVTELRVLTPTNGNPIENNNVSTSPHLAASLWRNVNVVIGNVALCQSFDNSYSIFKFWDSIIHNKIASFSMLHKREGLLLDNVSGKTESEDLIFYPVAPAVPDNAPIPPVVNKNGRVRAERIQQGRTVNLVSDFNVPLFRQGKLLPPNMEITVHLTKNYSEFILLSLNNNTERVVFDQVSLRCTFQRPTEIVLNILEERLARENAIYHADKNMLTFHSLAVGAEEVTIDNVFTGVLPYFFIYGVQDRAAFGKNRNKNPFSLYKMKSTNVHVDGQPHFPALIEGTQYEDSLMYSTFLDQSGLLEQDDALLGEYYSAYPAMACDLTQDKSQNQSCRNLSRHGSVRITIGFDAPIPENRVLVVMAYYDQIIEITKDRTISFV